MYSCTAVLFSCLLEMAVRAGWSPILIGCALASSRRQGGASCEEAGGSVSAATAAAMGALGAAGVGAVGAGLWFCNDYHKRRTATRDVINVVTVSPSAACTATAFSTRCRDGAAGRPRNLQVRGATRRRRVGWSVVGGS